MSSESANGQPPADSWASSAAQQNARNVGEAFVTRYYKLAALNPKELHKFYRKEALCSIGDSPEIVAGSAKIRDKIINSSLSGGRFDLVGGTFDFHPTPDEGILIMVTGNVTLPKTGVTTRFAQTFILRRELKDKTPVYFIENDVHRLLSETKSGPADSKPVQHEVPKADAPTPALALAAPAPAKQSVAAPAAAAAVAPVAAPVTAPVAAPPAKEAAAKRAEDEAPAKPSGPASWASIAAKEASSDARRRPVRRDTPAVTAEEDKTRPAAPTAAGAASGVLPGCSLFVKNVDPEAVSKQALVEYFSQFGAFSSLGVETTPTRKTAFVNYDATEPAKAAIAKGSFVINGVTLLVEERNIPGSRAGGARGAQAPPPTGRGPRPPRAPQASRGPGAAPAGGKANNGAARKAPREGETANLTQNAAVSGAQ